ncbi:elongation factor P maturation arginine rhamnosyltransferase EarP [Parashewanella curva]|uniref:Protein-arginine rhamnosyltransferase n=1 Tax=Parashewanella curva TaxID=2338552 RepID=A0A3L8PU84_9GAMM|nr:elongation factor P maturation arginine rhamnosyltransferase EarP [Parashewanella curva]RLV58890.1 elongation factor P maturation arginine rhamnosyltransferase EarP [Parashewanella curva]
MTSSKHWDIFCCVVDNYGDIGVTWRLAKQLADEHGISVKLWVDDLNSFKHILPNLDPTLEQQTINDITIIHWNDYTPQHWRAGETLIEAFACELPPTIIQQLSAAKTEAPVWINLEYLSAENWIDDCHGLISMHHSGARKYFYFPGFSEKSGGLICENHQLQRSINQHNNRQEFLKQFNIELTENKTKVISVFSYESAVLTDLCQYWIKQDQETHLLVPFGRSLNSLLPIFNTQLNTVNEGDSFKAGNLHMHILAMTNQEGYDKLLACCDFNIVRGEDSFLRAQWAQKPFLWHIYPQEENTHIEKLSAFNNLYTKNLSAEASKAYQDVSLAFNQDLQNDIDKKWQNLQNVMEEIHNFGRIWPQNALNGSDLASRLVEFVKNR